MVKTLVTAKINPDIDGTACALAYSNLLNQIGQDTESILFGSPQAETQYFVTQHNITIPTKPDGFDGGWDNFILVDMSDVKGMPKTVSVEKVIEIIDHREGEPEKSFPNAKIQSELIGAAATLIVERFIANNRELSIDQAKLLYGAIYHNTLNFTASNTSDRDRSAVQYLKQKFNFDKGLPQEMFLYATDRILTDIPRALKEDAKQFGNIDAYQLVVYGQKVLEKSDLITNCLAEISRGNESQWHFLNVVDLESKQSHIFASSNDGQNILNKTLGCNFKNNWCVLENVILRKQIIPMVQNVI